MYIAIEHFVNIKMYYVFITDNCSLFFYSGPHSYTLYNMYS